MFFMADSRFEFLFYWHTECYEKIIVACFEGEAPENFENFNLNWPPGANLTMEDVFIIIITISNFFEMKFSFGDSGTLQLS